MSASAIKRRLTPDDLHAVASPLDRMKELLLKRNCATRDSLQGAIAELEKLENLMASRSYGAGLQLKAFGDFLEDDPRLGKLKTLVEEQQAGFDLFEVLRIQEAEHVHSNFLAWLLDPRSDDAIGSSFLENFLKRTVAAAKEQDIPAISFDTLSAIDWPRTEIHREWNHIDILVLNRTARLVCAIENKINAEEGIDEYGRSQLTRYRQTLASEFPDFCYHHVFLSPRGMAPKTDTEQEFWVLEDYETIHQLVVETLRHIEDTAKPDVLWSLRQYEKTLRRNIVPETGEIAKLASQIYLEHREAIELIYQHKPDYPTTIRQVIKEAISQQEGWLLDVEDNRHVRFRPADWDRFESQRNGNGWGEDTPLLLFEVLCPREPLETKGPFLTLGESNDQNSNIRRQLFETARQDPRTFKLVQTSFRGWYMALHDQQQPLLEESDLSAGWADGTTHDKLTATVEDFARNEFPLINEAVIECFEQFEARPAEQG